MSWFARIEQACAAFIERTFAKTFPADLEPAQIARKLVATMEAQTRDDDGNLHAPGAYAVTMSRDDYERLAEHRRYLERAWADLLRNLARKVGVTFDGGRVAVTMSAAERIPLGAIEITVAGADAGDAQRSFRLLTIKGVPPDGVYEIGRRARIGRSDEGEIVLLDPSVSRAHAVIEIVRGAAVVRDLDSTNGTFVNGRRVTSRSLKSGDELRFGNTRMLLEAR